MQDLVIRPNVPADAPAIIAAIDRICAEGGCFHTPCFEPDQQWETALYRPGCAADHLLLLAEADGGRIAGFAQLLPLAGPGCGEKAGELGIGLLAAYRGRCIGRQLMAELLERAAGRGYRRAVLHVRAGNTRAVRLYRGLGFEVLGHGRRCYAYLGEEEELFMGCVLSEDHGG